MDDITNIPPALVNSPVSEWQLNIITIFFILQVLGRAYAAIKSGGGLVGIWKSIMFGSTQPKKDNENA